MRNERRGSLKQHRPRTTQRSAAAANCGQRGMPELTELGIARTASVLVSLIVVHLLERDRETRETERAKQREGEQLVWAGGILGSLLVLGSSEQKDPRSSRGPFRRQGEVCVACCAWGGGVLVLVPVLWCWCWRCQPLVSVSMLAG